MSGTSSGRGPVAPRTALVFALVGFAALLIAGLGVTSLLTSSDVIAVPGVSELPGILAVVAALAVFAAALWTGLRRENPSYWTALWAAVATFLAYLFGAAIGVLLTGHGIAVALAVVSALVTRWFGVVVIAAAIVSAWAGIALVRTRSGRPRWPWEADE